MSKKLIFSDSQRVTESKSCLSWAVSQEYPSRLSQPDTKASGSLQADMKGARRGGGNSSMGGRETPKRHRRSLLTFFFIWGLGK